MARRVKEEASVHRKRIAEAAGELYQKYGIENTTVDNVASAAGYSKATLYVYFKNKEEITGYLVLLSMQKLKEYIEQAITTGEDYRTRFLNICHSMEKYAAEYPYYFSLSLDYINIDFSNSKCEESERETYRVGEQINEMLSDFVEAGIRVSAFREMGNAKVVVFAIWGMVSGLVQLGSRKERYIESQMRLSRSAFMRQGFEVLYEAVRA